jgi:ribosomal subunit interface protein
MDIKLQTRNIDLTPAEQRRLRELNKRMSRYFRKILAVSWTFADSSSGATASCSVHAQSGHYRSKVSAERAGAAMDMAFDKIIRQRRRTRVRTVTARARSGSIRKAKSVAS